MSSTGIFSMCHQLDNLMRTSMMATTLWRFRLLCLVITVRLIRIVLVTSLAPCEFRKYLVSTSSILCKTSGVIIFRIYEYERVSQGYSIDGIALRHNFISKSRERLVLNKSILLFTHIIPELIMKNNNNNIASAPNPN